MRIPVRIVPAALALVVASLAGSPAVTLGQGAAASNPPTDAGPSAGAAIDGRRASDAQGCRAPDAREEPAAHLTAVSGGRHGHDGPS